MPEQEKNNYYFPNWFDFFEQSFFHPERIVSYIEWKNHFKTAILVGVELATLWATNNKEL